MSKPPREDAIEAEVERMKLRNKKLLSLLPALQQAHFLEIFRETLRHHPVFSRLLEQVHKYPASDKSRETAPPGVEELDPKAKGGAR